MIHNPCINRLYITTVQAKCTQVLYIENSYIHIDFLQVSANHVAMLREVKYFFHFLASIIVLSTLFSNTANLYLSITT
jgi:hypothetical protein